MDWVFQHVDKAIDRTIKKLKIYLYHWINIYWLLLLIVPLPLIFHEKYFIWSPFCTPLISCESRYCFQDWNLVADCGLASAAASANNWQHVKTDFNSNSSEVTLLPYNPTFSNLVIDIDKFHNRSFRPPYTKMLKQDNKINVVDIELRI